MPVLPRLGPPVTPPRIGVTGLTRIVKGANRSGVNAAYLKSVLRAGGLPLILSPLLGPEQAGSALEAIDGLLLTGGDDLDPAYYDEDPHPALDVIDRDRDAFEFAVFEAARERHTPTLAICRGFQLVNVSLGGNLWQDLPSQRPGAFAHRQEGGRDERSHEVEVVPGSKLSRALGTNRLSVNSFHHQGIRNLAPILRVTAVSPDGLAEGVEVGEGQPWLLGVQWHPEEFYAEPAPPDLGLFEALVREAARTAVAAPRT